MLVQLCLLMLAVAAEPADLTTTVLPGESRSNALQHQDFRKYASTARWDDALTEYNGLLARPFDLAPLTPRYLIQSRWLAHRDLGLLPAEMRQRLVEQRQTSARPMFEAALTQLDEPRLRRIVEEYYGSPAAAKAIDVLGDMAFLRGDFDAAEFWYGLLLPDRPSPRFPDLPTDAVRPRAKHLLARIFAHKRLGPLAAAATVLRADLDAFTRDHGQVRGSLAGREGTYGDILTTILKDRQIQAAPGELATFAGNPQRFSVQPIEEHLADRLAILTRRPLLRWDLERRQPNARPALPFAELGPRANAAMSLYPAVQGGQLYVADSRYLSTIDVKTGESRELFDALSVVPGLDPERTFPAPDLFRASVTVADGYVLARFGCVGLQGLKANPPSGESIIVCLRPRAEGPAELCWMVKGSTLNAQFEGAPLVQQGRAYVAAARVQGERTASQIACFSLTARGEATPAWTRDVCETREPHSGIRRLHHLLTLAGPNLVYASHSGAIIALDAITGQRVWAHRYRSAPRENRFALPGTEGLPPVHDLCPPLFAAGRVYVAPSDSDTLFCLDPLSGEVLWQREGIQAIHLLGVYLDRLIFTTPEGIRAVDARGGDRPGWVQPDGGGRLPPTGRGQLVGDTILWPTTRGVILLQAEDGRPLAAPLSPARLPPGNLLYQDGMLVSCGRTTLTLYHEPPRPAGLDKPRPPGADLPPEQRPQSWYRNALTWQRLEEPLEAARAWLALLDEPSAISTTLLDEQNRPWPAVALALHHLDRLRRSLPNEEVKALIDAHSGSANPLSRVTRDRIQEQLRSLEPNQPEARTLWRLLLRHGEGTLRAAALRALEKTRTRPGTSPLPTGWSLDRAVDLEPEERLISGSDRLLTSQPTATGSRLRLRTAEANSMLWHREIPFQPTWVRPCEEVLLLAGPGGLAGVRQDGVILWQVVSRVALDAFHLAGDRLFLRVGEGRLRAVDAFTGAILWEYGPGEAGLDLPAPHGRIDSQYAATDSRVLLRSWGKRHLLDAATGRSLRLDVAPETLGADDLLVLDDRRGLLIAERQTIELLDLTTGKSVWTWPVPASTTARNEPNRLLGVGESVWVQVPVNIGHEIYRLDLRSGKPLNEVPRLLRADPLDLSQGRSSRDTVFLIEGNEVVARSHLDAAIRWRLPLPPGPASHRLEILGDEVLVIPATNRIKATEFRCLVGRVEWMMGYPPSVGGLAPAAVLRLDTTTGKPRRLEVPTRLPRVTWTVRAEVQPYLRPEVATSDRSEPTELVLLPAPDGWRLVFGSHCWNVK